LKPDRGDEANILVQHLRREIFSGAEFGDLTGKFCRDFKVSGIIEEYLWLRLGKVGESDRREESLEITEAPLGSNSPFGNLPVRLGLCAKATSNSASVPGKTAISCSLSL
jgi:hypothetical protein